MIRDRKKSLVFFFFNFAPKAIAFSGPSGIDCAKLRLEIRTGTCFSKLISIFVRNFKVAEIRHLTYHFNRNFVLILKIISKIIGRGHLRSIGVDFENFEQKSKSASKSMFPFEFRKRFLRALNLSKVSTRAGISAGLKSNVCPLLYDGLKIKQFMVFRLRQAYCGFAKMRFYQFRNNL